MRDVGHLTELGLKLLIAFYDDYIQTAGGFDVYFAGWRPATINEFINTEFLVYLQENIISENDVFI